MKPIGTAFSLDVFMLWSHFGILTRLGLCRLLDMGFRKDVEDIISYLPNKNDRQTLLFSATVPPEVKAVMGQTMRSNFVTVDCIHDTDPASHTNSQVEQTHVIVPSATRWVTGTVDIVCKLIHDTRAAGEPLKLVVFFNTAHLVSFYASLFNDGLGISVLELHSRKSQSFRTRTADAFRAAAEAILFTSDVSARGVDYPGVTDVVQVRWRSRCL
jgi:ATP-dependent RNA helicase MSS116, mitochondrial